MNNRMHWTNYMRDNKISIQNEPTNKYESKKNLVPCNLPTDAGDLKSVNGVRIPRPRAGIPEP